MKLIGLRVNAGYSRDDLARELGIGKETIRLAECGFVPTPRIQFALANHFRLLPLDIWPAKDQRVPVKPRLAA